MGETRNILGFCFCAEWYACSAEDTNIAACSSYTGSEIFFYKMTSWIKKGTKKLVAGVAFWVRKRSKGKVVCVVYGIIKQ